MVYESDSSSIIPCPPLLITAAASIPTALPVTFNLIVWSPSFRSWVSNHFCPTARFDAFVSTVTGSPSSTVISTVPWPGSIVPKKYAFVPWNFSSNSASLFAHVFVPLMYCGWFSGFHFPVNLNPFLSPRSVSVTSITSIPFGIGLAFSIPSVVLYTPTSLIIGTFPSVVPTVILIWRAVVSLVLQRRFAPIVCPSSKTVHAPSVPVRYSTL